MTSFAESWDGATASSMALAAMALGRNSRSAPRSRRYRGLRAEDRGFNCAMPSHRLAASPRSPAAELELAATQPLPPATSPRGQRTRLPLPRFVSLKSEPRQFRHGPGDRTTRSPGCITKPACPWRSSQEFENWRRVRDADGTEGWVSQSLLIGKRTAMVAPWNEATDSDPALAKPRPMRRRPPPSPALVAKIEARRASPDDHRLHMAAGAQSAVWRAYTAIGRADAMLVGRTSATAS